MNKSTDDKTLIALLLTFKKVDISLTETQLEQFYEIGEQLYLDPDDWDFIKEGLLESIALIPTIEQKFNLILNHLDTLEPTQIQQLLPTSDEMQQALTSANNLERRGYIEGEADFISDEILNKSRQIAQKIFRENDPIAKSKNLNWLNRLEAILINLFEEKI